MGSQHAENCCIAAILESMEGTVAVVSDNYSKPTAAGKRGVGIRMADYRTERVTPRCRKFFRYRHCP